MNEGSEKALSRRAGRESSDFKRRDDARASGLMESEGGPSVFAGDAVVSKRDSDELAKQLRGEIAARQGIENELNSSRERLQLLSESFQDFAIFTTDNEGNVVTWNPGAEAIFGYTESEMLGRNSRILFVPEDQESGEAEHEMETARTRGRAADERWHLRKDGWRFYASGIMAPLYYGPNLIGFAKIARDLTAQKESEEMMRRHRSELERVVRERTEALEQANDALRKEIQERRLIEEERTALLERIVTTQEDERRRIARDMHDSLGQQLTALRLKLASLKLEHPSNPRLNDTIEVLQRLGAKVDAEVNFLVWELRPTVLDDLGLISAIENYAREWSRHYGIAADFHAGRLGRERLDGNIETNLYRILQEALNNTFKHSQAHGVNILLESRGAEIVLVVEDDGVGFDPDSSEGPHRAGSGLGLIGMRERATIIGGSIEIESSPGQGTTVFVRVPINARKGLQGG